MPGPEGGHQAEMQSHRTEPARRSAEMLSHRAESAQHSAAQPHLTELQAVKVEQEPARAQGISATDLAKLHHMMREGAGSGASVKRKGSGEGCGRSDSDERLAARLQAEELASFQRLSARQAAGSVNGRGSMQSVQRQAPRGPLDAFFKRRKG